MPERPPILVPIRVLEGDSIPDGVPELLARAHVVLLGYHVVPEQTATGQARMQFEERARGRLDTFEEILEDAGATVERRLVFTHDGQQTIDRTIYEHDCLAVLVPDAVDDPEAVLVPVRGTVGVDRLARVVAGLFADTDASVTLYHVADEDETDEDVETLLSAVSASLDEKGLDASRISTLVERDRDPLPALVEASTDHDVVVMGETDPSLITYVFGMPADQVASQFPGPVFVVQRERPTEEGEAENRPGR